MKCTVCGIWVMILQYLYMMRDHNQTYYGNIFEIHRNIEPLYCITGTHIMSSQLYLKNKQKNKFIEKGSDLQLPEERAEWRENWMKAQKV